MSAPVRVARVDELPPGWGKLVSLGARDLAVYNLEGRFFASCAHRPHVGGAEPPGHAASSTVCGPHGVYFEATAEDSPSRVRSGEPRYRVDVDGEFVVVFLEDAAAD